MDGDAVGDFRCRLSGVVGSTISDERKSSPWRGAECAGDEHTASGGEGGGGMCSKVRFYAGRRQERQTCSLGLGKDKVGGWAEKQGQLI